MAIASALARQLLYDLRLQTDLAGSVALIHSSPPETLRTAAIEVLSGMLHEINDFDDIQPGGLYRLGKSAAERCADKAAASGSTLYARLASFTGLISLCAALVKRRIDRLTRAETDAQDADLRVLFDAANVGTAVYDLYDPKFDSVQDPQITSQDAREEWKQLDPSRFSYYTAGTTSFILKVHRRPEFQQRALALKCVMYPWNDVPSVARNTALYATRYNPYAGQTLAIDPTTYKVEILQSSSRWVLMDFQYGETLDERLIAFEDSLRLSAPSTGGIRRKWKLLTEPHTRVKMAKDVTLQLLTALRGLADGRPIDGTSAKTLHLDLSPKNIICVPTGNGDVSLRLIDFGMNHLYTRQVGVIDAEESVYVAVEVRNRQMSATSDLYSVAVIMTRILTGQVPVDGLVPDAVYELSPTLGYLIEDMMESDATKRLLLVRGGQTLDLRNFYRLVEETFRLVEQEKETSDSAIDVLWTKFSPSSSEWLVRLRQAKAAAKMRELGQLSGVLWYLSLASSLALFSWAWILGFSTVAALFSVNFMGFINDQRNNPAAPSALYASIIALSQGLTAAKYYQTVLARLTLIGTRDWFAAPTEVLVRLTALVALPTTIIAINLGISDAWAWSCALGALAVASVNLLTWIAARRLSQRGIDAGFSTAQPVTPRRGAGYGQWWWSMTLYAIVIAVIATGLGHGWLSDEGAYVFGLVLISIGIHYVSKCCLGGPAVRGLLARAYSLGRRTEAARLNAQATQPGVPSFRDRRPIGGW